MVVLRRAAPRPGERKCAGYKIPRGDCFLLENCRKNKIKRSDKGWDNWIVGANDTGFFSIRRERLSRRLLLSQAIAWATRFPQRRRLFRWYRNRAGRPDDRKARYNDHRNISIAEHARALSSLRPSIAHTMPVQNQIHLWMAERM